MDPREFHRLAAVLTDGAGPAHWRSAASRAFYAVFNLGVLYLRDVVPLRKGAQAHGQVRNLLATCSDPDLQRVGNDLGELHSRRIDADYDLGNVDAENVVTVRGIIVESEEMIQRIDRAFGGPAAQAIKQSI